MFKQLSEKYEIHELIGKGGMGEVYKAIHKGLNRTVAIKMLSPEIMDNEEFRKRFQQEAQIIAQLDHKNIIKVYDIDTYDNKLCIIMEHIDGESLESVLKKKEKFDITYSIELIIKIAQALDYAHNKGIIHRDIKPDNIMVDMSENIKLMDFGIARMVDTTLNTQTGLSMGTPKYMSPEQAEGKKVKKTTDIYSLGIILYRLVAGKVPFDADNFVAIAMMHIKELPTPPEKINPKIDKKLSTIILKCIEKDEKNRFQSCRELSDTLTEYKFSLLQRDVTRTAKVEKPISLTTAMTSETLPFETSEEKSEMIHGHREKVAHLKSKTNKLYYLIGIIIFIVLLSYLAIKIYKSEKQYKTEKENKSSNKIVEKKLTSEDLSSYKSLESLKTKWENIKFSDNLEEKSKLLKELVNYYPIENGSKEWKKAYGELLCYDGIKNNDKDKLMEGKKHLEEVKKDFEGTKDLETIVQLIDNVNNILQNKK